MKNQSLTSPTPTPPVETGRFFICINMVDKKERTKIAYDYGYRVSVEGTVTLNGNLVSIREQKKKNSDRTLLYFYFHKLKTNIYVSKLQAY